MTSMLRKGSSDKNCYSVFDAQVHATPAAHGLTCGATPPSRRTGVSGRRRADLPDDRRRLVDDLRLAGSGKGASTDAPLSLFALDYPRRATPALTAAAASRVSSVASGRPRLMLSAR